MDEIEPIKALSWKQHYASLMLKGKIETRSWPTNYRGLVLICASKAPYSIKEIKSMSGDETLIRINDMLTGFCPNGVAIAVGRLVDCRKMRIEDEEKAFVKFNEELYCHIYEDVRPIKTPFPYKGRQKWGKITKEQLDLINKTGE